MSRDFYLLLKQERYWMIKKTFGLAALAAVTFAGVAEARDQINIVGSSTVYPFATVVAAVTYTHLTLPTILLV